jgi:hypothetical protein
MKGLLYKKIEIKDYCLAWNVIGELLNITYWGGKGNEFRKNS